MHYPIRILVAFSALWTFCTAFILDYRGFDVRTPLVQKGCKGSPSDDIHPVMDFSISPSVSISIRRRFLAPSTLFSSSTSELDIPSDMEEEMRVDVVNARNRLLMETKNLVENSITGLFLTIPSDRFAFQKLVTQLEVLAPATFTQRDLLQCIGDWELLCTSRGPTVSSSKEETKSSQSLPFSLPKPPDSVRKSISVVQRIVAENDSNIINRIDHIIEYTPLSLQQLIPEESPLKIIRDLNINPLEVSRTKLTLVHNAQVESLTPVFRTKISLKNVTGKYSLNIFYTYHALLINFSI
jgi:hypothetical protein